MSMDAWFQCWTRSEKCSEERLEAFLRVFRVLGARGMAYRAAEVHARSASWPQNRQSLERLERFQILMTKMVRSSWILDFFPFLFELRCGSLKAGQEVETVRAAGCGEPAAAGERAGGAHGARECSGGAGGGEAGAGEAPGGARQGAGAAPGGLPAATAAARREGAGLAGGAAESQRWAGAEGGRESVDLYLRLARVYMSKSELWGNAVSFIHTDIANDDVTPSMISHWYCRSWYFDVWELVLL